MEAISPQAQQLLDQIDRQAEESQRRADAAARLAENVDHLRVSESSRYREVTVEVDAQGHVTDIQFTSNAFRLTTDTLGKTVLDTITRARTKAGRQAVNLISDTYGPDSPVTQRLAETYAVGSDDSPPTTTQGVRSSYTQYR